MRSETIDLVPPLSGYTIIETLVRVYIPAVASLDPGKGHVSDLLAYSMERADEVVVPCVLSPILQGMLERRGFMVEPQWVAEMDEYVECMVWRKPKPVEP